MKLKAFFTAALIAATATLPANAQWIRQEKEDPFGSDNLLLALTANQPYGFGLRCGTQSKTLEAVFITPESVEKGFVVALNLLSPKMLIRVDDGSIEEQDVQFDRSEQGALVAISTVSKEIGAKIGSAHKRIAVAIGVGDEKVHKSSFGVIGIKQATFPLLNACSQAKP